jgi:adenosylhomocysteine nucleosidase
VKILVTFAVDAEFAPWRKRHKFTAARVGNMTFHISSIAGIETHVLLTGIGSRRAESVLTFLLLQADKEYEACISAGLAGALRAEHRIGEILAAPRVVEEKTLHNSPENGGIPASEPLLQLAKQCGATSSGKFLTVDHLVATVEEKTKLSAFADAVDMESYAVVRSALAWVVRGIAIRAISDLATENLSLDLTSAIDDSGMVEKRKVLKEVLRHPLAIPGLVRLGWNSQKSARALARFLDRYVTALSKYRPEIEAVRTEMQPAT